MWADTVKSWLATYGLSQAWLARRAGYSEHHLSRCMLSKVAPSDLMLQKLADEMNKLGHSADGDIVLEQRPVETAT
jgi:transcriptional regulator with XRE-family HTH domain